MWGGGRGGELRQVGGGVCVVRFRCVVCGMWGRGRGGELRQEMTPVVCNP